jgi:peptide/nickel transport system permease protein
MDILIVKWAADVGTVIVVLASLSFIGVGAQPPSAEWGAMVANSQGYISTAWWAATAPGVALLITACAFGLLGDMLQVRLDPALHE